MLIVECFSVLQRGSRASFIGRAAYTRRIWTEQRGCIQVEGDNGAIPRAFHGQVTYSYFQGVDQNMLCSIPDVFVVYLRPSSAVKLLCNATSHLARLQRDFHQYTFCPCLPFCSISTQPEKAKYCSHSRLNTRKDAKLVTTSGILTWCIGTRKGTRHKFFELIQPTMKVKKVQIGLPGERGTLPIPRTCLIRSNALLVEIKGDIVCCDGTPIWGLGVDSRHASRA